LWALALSAPLTLVADLWKARDEGSSVNNKHAERINNDNISKTTIITIFQKIKIKIMISINTQP
jgi:hypothetical protein